MNSENKLAFRLGITLVKICGLESCGPEKSKEFRIQCRLAREIMTALQIPIAGKMLKDSIDDTSIERSGNGSLFNEYNNLYLDVEDCLGIKHPTETVKAFSLGWQIATLHLLFRIASNSEVLISGAEILLNTLSYFEGKLSKKLIKSIIELCDKSKEVTPKSSQALELGKLVTDTFELISNELITIDSIVHIRDRQYIFIGHGRSKDWLELNKFIVDRLRIQCEEFNRVAIAGKHTVERLQEMLTNSCFAFLVLTAEDIHADESVHARENVVHEVGLFQGRLGFNKAIIVLEEGCLEFSNIAGLGQIRFQKNKISSCFEDIRQVLEREEIITSKF